MGRNMQKQENMFIKLFLEERCYAIQRQSQVLTIISESKSRLLHNMRNDGFKKKQRKTNGEKGIYIYHIYTA